MAKGFPGIIVMPEGARGWYANWWNGGRRAGPAWERYHLDELVPLVERRLPILRARRWHAIAGLSMGGEGALFYASQRPGYFGSAASVLGSDLDPATGVAVAASTPRASSHDDVFGDPDAQRFYWTGHNPTALAANLRWTRLYVTVGDGVAEPSEVENEFGQAAELDLHQHAEDFTAAARKAGADVTYVPRDGIHDWPYWREHLAAALRWGFFAPVRESPTDWTYETVAAKGDAWGWRFEFQRRAPDRAHHPLAPRRRAARRGLRPRGDQAARRANVRGQAAVRAPDLDPNSGHRGAGKPTSDELSSPMAYLTHQ